MTYHKAIQKLFDYFYNKFYKGQFHLDIEREDHKKMIDNFVKMLGTQFQLPNVGVNYLLEYFCFAFHYWKDKKTKRNITLNWIIGKKMFGQWLERKSGVDYYIAKFLQEYEIDIDVLRQQLVQSEDKGYLDPSEELEKQKFNGEARLYNCLMHTTLYNHRSMICLFCDSKIVCKRFLNNTSPGLYSKRGYVTNESA